MNTYLFTYYTFFNNPIILLTRIIFFVGALILFALNVNNPSFVTLFFPLYFLFIGSEVFILFHVNVARPRKTVEEVHTPIDVTTFRSRMMLGAKESFEFVQHARKLDEVHFMIKRMGGYAVTQVDIPKDLLLEKAAELTKKVHGLYIHEVDIVAAYIILSEQTTKSLENVELTTDDVTYILQWARSYYHIDKNTVNIGYSGNGTFDSLVYGWNYETKKYALDYTSLVLSEKHPPVAKGRQKEFNEMCSILSKQSTNNVILLGEPGTGKTTLANHFTYSSYTGDVPAHLRHKKVFELMVDRLLAGVNNQGELDARLNLLMDEIVHSGNVVLFIQNIGNIFGGGGFGMDLSGTLFEYLKNGRIQIIGTATPAQYKTIIARNETVNSLFETVKVEEPPQELAILMLFEKAAHLEKKNGVSISYDALKEAVTLASSYFPDQFLPGKAINLLENVISTALLQNKHEIEKADVTNQVEEKTHIVLNKPTDQEKQLLLHLEDKIHERIIDQEEAVSAVAKALRRLRSGFVNHKRPISVFLFLGPTGVGKTETAKALASLYFRSEESMIRLDMSEFQTETQISRLLGATSRDYVSHSLVDQVREHPFSLVLLDEFEKAHPRILDMFLQVFDDGRMTDNSGKTVSFTNCIIIATSNAGSELIREHIEQNREGQLKKILLDNLLKNQIYKPELLNRFDEIVVFKPLTQEHAKQIARLLLIDAFKKLEEQQIHVSFEDALLTKIVHDSYDAQFGARNIRRYIEGTLEDILSKQILEGKIKKGESVKLTVDENNQMVVG